MTAPSPAAPGSGAGRTASRPIISVHGLSKRYGELLAVDDVSFEVEAGEVFGILGPNGAGSASACGSGSRCSAPGSCSSSWWGWGFMIFLAMGYGIAGWAKNEDQAAPVANLVSLPMLFLSGVFFPREAMPELLRGVTQYMPLTYVNEALRGVMNDGASLADLGTQLLGMGIWAVVAFAVAVWLFPWE